MNEIKEKSNLLDIKSLYIIKNVFSFLQLKQKLAIIIFNKNIQKKLNINIEDYKKVSNKYKKDKYNGKGKEYIKNTERLIFKGEYKNGKKMEKEKNIIIMEY